jgi:hypothetical protein
VSDIEHTWGPWTADIESYRVKIVAGERYIARLGAEGDYREEQIANARLMASAPDLLAACKMLLAELCNDITPACDAGRAAIIKAEGGGK